MMPCNFGFFLNMCVHACIHKFAPDSHARVHTHTHTHILVRTHTQWVANALVPTLGIVSMSYTGTTHPPAAACATVYIFDSTGTEIECVRYR
jgi:hypothetical protein